MSEPERNPNLVAVGKAIRALREERGMSRGDLARAAGITDDLLDAVEDGRDELRFDLYCALARGLNVGLAAFPTRVAEEGGEA
jgi:transcriptional regulator with XRE-family HTH domain